MSEKGKRGGASNPGSGKATTTSDGRKFAAALQKLANDFDTLCKSADGAQAYGDLLGSQTTLKQKLGESQQEVAGLRRDIEALRAEWDQDVRRLENDISELKRRKDALMADNGEKYKDWDADKRRYANSLEE